MYTGRDFRLLNETLKSHSDAGDNNGNKVTNVKKKNKMCSGQACTQNSQVRHT